MLNHLHVSYVYCCHTISQAATLSHLEAHSTLKSRFITSLSTWLRQYLGQVMTELTGPIFDLPDMKTMGPGGDLDYL